MDHLIAGKSLQTFRHLNANVRYMAFDWMHISHRPYFIVGNCLYRNNRRELG